jgi:hypothetical protein
LTRLDLKKYKNYFLTGAGATAEAGAGLAAGAATAIGAATAAFLAFLAAFLAAFFSALAASTAGTAVSEETVTGAALEAEAGAGVCALAEEANNATTARISENFFMFFSKMIFINADFRSVFFLKIIIIL